MRLLDYHHRRFLHVAAALIYFGTGSPSTEAAIVTSVAAPLVMTRPDDGVLYGFPVDIDLTAGAGDAAGSKLLVVFQTVGGINLDALNLVFPAGVKAGDMLSAGIGMLVGCRPTNTGGMEIFGPLGGTGAANIMGQFAFGNGQIFGPNMVSCTNPAIMPNPSNGPQGQLPQGPEGSPPYVPGTIPDVTLSFASVPEPSSIVLAGLGFLTVGVGSLRRRRSNG